MMNYEPWANPIARALESFVQLVLDPAIKVT